MDGTSQDSVRKHRGDPKCLCKAKKIKTQGSLIAVVLTFIDLFLLAVPSEQLAGAIYVP